MFHKFLAQKKAHHTKSNIRGMEGNYPNKNEDKMKWKSP